MLKSKLSSVVNDELENTKNGETQVAPPKQAILKPFRYKNPFIDESLVKSVAGETEKIKNHLITQGMVEIKTGDLLLVLRGRFEAIALDRGNVPAEEHRQAFFEYVQIQFGIKESRAKEYIQVSLKLGTFTPELNLDISKMVEISRLEKASIQNMIDTYSVEKIMEMNYRQLKNVVRKYNPKSRDTTKVIKPQKKTPALSEKAEVNNEVVASPNLGRFKPTDIESFTQSFSLSVKTIKEMVSVGPLSKELVMLIDELYQLKNKKEVKKTSGKRKL